MVILAFVIFCLAYLFGSFPSGYFAGKLSGVDIRAKGSGNIGATNVLRVLGKGWGYAVFFADVLKGFAAVRLTFAIVSHFPWASASAEYFAVLAAVMCILGHTFPVWLRFKGGKGVATSVGVVFGLMPIAAITIFAIWVAVFETTRYVSVASVVAALSLPVTLGLLLYWKITDAVILLYFSIVMALLVVWRHRSNFARLLNGTEQRFNRK